MKNLCRKVSTSLVVGIIGASISLAALPVVSAQLITGGDSPINVSGATGGIGNFRELALIMIDFFLSFLGFIAVIFVIYGGILYVTARGQQEKLDEAKKILTYSAIGIIVILLSFALVNTILSAGTGQEPSA